jgi:hypothetical protein
MYTSLAIVAIVACPAFAKLAAWLLREAELEAPRCFFTFLQEPFPAPP